MKNSVSYRTHRQATCSDIRGDWDGIRFVWKWDALGKMAEAYPGLLWLYGGSNSALLKAMHSKTQFLGHAELRCQKKIGVSLSWQLGYCYTPYWLYKLAGRRGGLQEHRNVGHFLPHYTISHPTRNWIVQTNDFTVKSPDTKFGYNTARMWNFMAMLHPNWCCQLRYVHSCFVNFLNKTLQM
jgi:hypothetical protein